MFFRAIHWQIPEMSLTSLTSLTTGICEKSKCWISISCKALQCIQRAIQPLFLWKNGRADGRKNLLFGVLRIVFGLQLSICGDVDLPILGSNLVKIGVQGAIFCNFWWSFNWSARFRMWRVSGCLDIYEQNRKVLIDSAWATANDLEYLLLHEWSGCTSTLLHNCLLQCKYNDFSAILQRFCHIFGHEIKKNQEK